MGVWGSERKVHRVRSMIVIRLKGLPVLVTQDEFRKLCEECFSHAPLNSAKLTMAVLTDTAPSKREIPKLEKEFASFIEKTVIGERGELVNDCVFFEMQANQFLLDFLEVSRWYYRRLTYETAYLEFGRGQLLTLKSYDRSILPSVFRRWTHENHFLASEINVLCGGWWDFRFSDCEDDWFRVRKGVLSRDHDFELSVEDL